MTDNLVHFESRKTTSASEPVVPLIIPDEGLHLPPAEDVQRQILAELRETNRLLRRALGIR